MNTKPKFKVGDRWKNRMGEIVEIAIIRDFSFSDKENRYYTLESGKSFASEELDLTEKVESAPIEYHDHVIDRFSRIVFDLESNPHLDEHTEVRVPLSELATVARKLYAYEKFVTELKESLKDGDDKRRILAKKIEEL